MGRVIDDFEGETINEARRNVVSRRDAEITAIIKECFLDLVDAAAKESHFQNIWASSQNNRLLLYVRVVRQMREMVIGAPESPTGPKDGALQDHFDTWRLRLCDFSAVPDGVIIRLLASVLLDCLAGDLEHETGPRPASAPATKTGRRRIKDKHSVGALLSWGDDEAGDEPERLLERAIGHAAPSQVPQRSHAA